MKKTKSLVFYRPRAFGSRFASQAVACDWGAHPPPTGATPQSLFCDNKGCAALPTTQQASHDQTPRSRR